ncbi:protein L [Luteibacter sp.]|uniref:protein L n=1 Tax=Luteibacter sp. TaxID=1886636 RepID=UPI003F81301F
MSAYVPARSILRSVLDTNEWWRKTYHTGETVPVSGIYRCEGCGREDCCNENDPFPPQNHHQHTVAQGKIRWRLNVRADHKPA